MTYNTPTLNLVGAAQNLVLEGSLDREAFVAKEDQQICNGPIEDSPVNYNVGASW